jgi:hypothetical protein
MRGEALARGEDAMAEVAARFGNAAFVDMAVGESCEFLEKKVTLVAVDQSRVVVDVDGVRELVGVGRYHLPSDINGVRVIGSCLWKWREMALKPKKGHMPVERDALLCLSDASKPLLERERFTFPVSRRDGWQWFCEEESHMHQWLGSEWFRAGEAHTNRFHEGIDLAMHDARGKEIHPLVAIEDADVRQVWNPAGTPLETCVLLQSRAQPRIFYAYQHLNIATLRVEPGEMVKRGQFLGCIWGDGAWGHLHFALTFQDEVPAEKPNAYRNLLNAFPFLYEIYHGSLDYRRPPRTEGDFEFGNHRYLCCSDKGGTGFNNQHSFAYNEPCGYGWLLDGWMAAGWMHYNRGEDGDYCNVYGLRTMWADGDDVVGDGFRADVPDGTYRFAVRVEPGRYRVSAVVGDRTERSAQHVTFNAVEAGLYRLRGGESKETPEVEVDAPDGMLTVALELADDTRIAIHRLVFDTA